MKTDTMKIRFLFLLLISFHLSAICFSQEAGNVPDYTFDGKISEGVLRNYLNRAITMAEVCTYPDIKLDGKDNTREDDIRLIQNIEAKFIGRALFRWGGEQHLNTPEFLNYAKEFIDEVHVFDPDVVFQAAIFEAVSKNVEQIPVPERVFTAYGLAVEERNFNYTAMLFKDGLYKNQWGDNNSVPDIRQLETRLWYYYLATRYIDAGFEALHWGQVALIGAKDKNLKHWFEMLETIRTYARDNSRRHFVINDAHAPDGGFKSKESLLMDFHSFPLRIKAVEETPMKGMLEVGQTDAIYHRSMGGLTASGWSCEHLPFLVEFDNFGISNHAGKANNQDHFIWGYDEISWLSLKSPEEQKEWLEYAYTWLKMNDENGYLQMPVCRIVVNGKDPAYKYKAHIKSEACPDGTGLENKIKELWSEKNDLN
jgi:hypothetical protein